MADTNTTPHGSPVETIKTPRRPLLATLFSLLVLAIALFQFSENTSDPDLFGHVAFGRDMIKTHTIEKTEIYSWTAHGQPFVNHEFFADVILGATHSLLGGSGILLLKVVVGLLTFALALQLGGAGLKWPSRAWLWAIGAVAVVEISFGFAARPQIFTALCLAIELWVLRKIHREEIVWALVLPPMYVFWINTHGGALAGCGLLFLVTGVTTLEAICSRMSFGSRFGATAVRGRVLATLWLSCVFVVAALFCNPWGPEMITWLIRSVLWLRPEIAEWNPTPFNWDHAAFFMLLLITIFAWAMTRERRPWWELAACAAFIFLGWRAVRNAPLFSIVALATVPVHFVSAIGRWHEQFAERLNAFRQSRGLQMFCSGVLVAGIIYAVIATFTQHKEHPLTMEVPKKQYPVTAMEFIRQKQLHGKTLVFFDWGDFSIFNLPQCPPSIDGRLDACYSRELIAAHWHLYNGEPVDEKVLNLDEADLALLPYDLKGALDLSKRPGWYAAYVDGTAAVLVHDRTRDRFRSPPLALAGPEDASIGRVPFPSEPARR